MFTTNDIFREVRRLTLGFQADLENSYSPEQASWRTRGTILPDGTADPNKWYERYDGIRVFDPHTVV